MDTGNREYTPGPETGAFHADGQIALIKPLVVEGKPGYGLQAMDGTLLGWFDQLDVAVAAARQHNLTPVTVH